ncbi:hypothetical protein RSOLAG22IIIB_13632 [Rhizoctonia solani]|uniref:Hemerythrin-like domain-containing protein n=1 Tax=Rhizoctonia solani TaxID=456999 RepID=A0A0K6FP43_9AGAM|nr:hypothetical protein RSOLAG22IIIB_13632 [Rhizoctonia solani]
MSGKDQGLLAQPPHLQRGLSSGSSGNSGRGGTQLDPEISQRWSPSLGALGALELSQSSTLFADARAPSSDLPHGRQAPFPACPIKRQIPPPRSWIKGPSVEPTEEEVMFPYFEEKLGKGAMDANINQHHGFMPQFDEWNEHCKKILAKEETYEPTKFVAMLRKSTDVLSVHLVDEIPTIEASIMKEHFTDAELRELEARVTKKIKECTSVWLMPIVFVSGDLSHNPWFPEEVPAPVLFFARHIAMRIEGDMWKWGQSDRYGRLKDEFKSMYGMANS